MILMDALCMRAPQQGRTNGDCDALLFSVKRIVNDDANNKLATYTLAIPTATNVLTATPTERIGIPANNANRKKNKNTWDGGFTARMPTTNNEAASGGVRVPTDHVEWVEPT